MSEKLMLTVPDMTCGGCKARVTRALKNVPGVLEVEADVPTRQVVVELTAEVPAEALRDAVTKAGYTVSN